jgi:hypothetical protein
VPNPKRAWPQAKIRRLAAMCQRGLSTTQVARSLGCSHGSVKYARRFCRLSPRRPFRPKVWTDELLTQLIFLRQGKTMKECASILEKSMSATASAYYYNPRSAKIRRQLGIQLHSTTILKRGTRFGNLVVIRRGPNNRWGQTQWLCRCKCGRRKQVTADRLMRGRTRGCGTHKLSGKDSPHYKNGFYTPRMKPLTHCFNSMHYRCDPRHADDYKDYAGRGITVCTGWSKTEEGRRSFFADMAPRPKNRSLDRINVNGHYSCGHCEQCIEKGWPKNVRWGTKKQQRNNQRPRRTTPEEAVKIIAHLDRRDAEQNPF